MFYSARLYLRDRWIGSSVAGGTLCFIMSLWYALRHIPAAGEPIFLHYNSIFGVDLVGEWWKLLFIPGLGLLMLLANGLISWRIFTTERVAARFIMLCTTVLELALWLEVMFIVHLNS